MIEFFESFNIEPMVEFKSSAGDWVRGTYYAYINRDKKDKWRVATIITAEIREKLEEIILSKLYEISYGICGRTKKTRHWTIELSEGWMPNNDKYWWTIMKKDRNELILHACIELKDEIYNEVRDLFVTIS